MLRTSSKQQGVKDRLPCLPHTVIRPPLPASDPNSSVLDMLAVLTEKVQSEACYILSTVACM